MTTPATTPPAPPREPVLFAYQPPHVEPFAPARLKLLLLVGLLAAFMIIPVMWFGAGWLIIGLIGVVAVLLYDEYLRFDRNRTLLWITTDGALVVSRWNGEQRHWLPLAQQVELIEFRHEGADSFDGNRPFLGTGFRIILRLDGQADVRVTLPGGHRYFPGSGPNIDDESRRQFLEAASRFTKTG